MPFETTQTNHESGVVLLALSGSLTMGNQLQRLEWLVEELVKKNQTRIVMDLSQISYLDSAGIGVILKCSGLAKQAGGHLNLAAPTERVLSTLKLVSLDTILTINATPAEAISALSS